MSIKSSINLVLTLTRHLHKSDFCSAVFLDWWINEEKKKKIPEDISGDPTVATCMIGTLTYVSGIDQAYHW